MTLISSTLPSIFQGDSNELATSLPALTELDLTCNLLHSWDVAEGICQALTGLKVGYKHKG